MPTPDDDLEKDRPFLANDLQMSEGMSPDLANTVASNLVARGNPAGPYYLATQRARARRLDSEAQDQAYQARQAKDQADYNDYVAALEADKRANGGRGMLGPDEQFTPQDEIARNRAAVVQMNREAAQRRLATKRPLTSHYPALAAAMQAGQPITTPMAHYTALSTVLSAAQRGVRPSGY